MNKFTKVSLIIAAVMGGIGILLCGIATLMGGGYRTVVRMANEGELDLGSWHIGPDVIYDESWLDEADSAESASYEITQIRNLDLDIGAAELILKEGSDADHIKVTLNRGYTDYFKNEMDGDTLKVVYHLKNNNYYLYGNTNAKITVEVPSGIQFDDINMEVGAAKLDIDMDEVGCENLSIDVGAGKLEADGFMVSGRTEITVGAGEVNLDGGQYQDISVDCGMGKFDMDGSVKGDLTAMCGMGNMDIELEGNETDYNYDLSCDMGELKINDTHYSMLSGSRRIDNQGAVGTIRLDCNMGTVKLKVN